MDRKIKARIKIYYQIGDSPVRHDEIFEADITYDTLNKINTYTTSKATLRQMFGNTVSGTITGGEAQKISEVIIEKSKQKKQRDEDKEQDIDDDGYTNKNDSIWSKPYWLIPFRMIWKIFVTILKYIWKFFVGILNFIWNDLILGDK